MKFVSLLQNLFLFLGSSLKCLQTYEGIDKSLWCSSHLGSLFFLFKGYWDLNNLYIGLPGVIPSFFKYIRNRGLDEDSGLPFFLPTGRRRRRELRACPTTEGDARGRRRDARRPRPRRCERRRRDAGQPATGEMQREERDEREEARCGMTSESARCEEEEARCGTMTGEMRDDRGMNERGDED
ncbi:hypothetical protein Syun_009347 [Stephania yunnanensis]|uniref:Uncharacterized protein n=1 Tax=Stephania yunnanensis TaxID=152371 RepID=A0AAP0KFZ9_9MAGN